MELTNPVQTRLQQEIKNLLENYFDGLYYSRAEQLEKLFHPRAHYVCATSGELRYLTMDQYLPMVAGRPSPASRCETRRDRIVSIELLGPVTAAARVECAIDNQFYHDLLSLIKLDSRWQIISKVFHYEFI